MKKTIGGWLLLCWALNAVAVVQFNLTTGGGGPGSPPGVPISWSIEPVGAGRVAAAGTFASGSGVSLLATANPGAVFSHWTGPGGFFSMNRTNSFVATQAASFTAHFAPAITTVNLNPGGASVNGLYAPLYVGETYTVHAEVTNRWYEFMGWYLMLPGGNDPQFWDFATPAQLVSMNPDFSFQSDGTGVHLGAQFAFTRRQFRFDVNSDPPLGGYLQDESGHLSTEWHEQIWEQDWRIWRTISAVPNPGFQFDGWKSQDGTVVMNRTNAFVIDTNGAWTAQFSPTCTVAVLRFEWASLAAHHLKGIAQISRQVQTVEVPAGTNVVLHVYPPLYGFSPSGNPVTSRWRHSGKALAEQSNTLALSNVTRRDGGIYRFLFHLENGTYTSSMVQLRVIEPRRR